MKGKMFLCGIGTLALLSVVAMTSVSAQPTADSFEVKDATGELSSYVMVPVNITNTSNGPIMTIIFNIAYDKNVLTVTDIRGYELTSNWNNIRFSNRFSWGTRVFVATGLTDQAIPNGSRGSVLRLNFSVIGGTPFKADMNLSDIQFSDPEGNEGTAPAKNGTFYVSGAIFDTDRGTYPSIFGTHIGTITPNRDIIVHKLHTYSCEGTGGHTEYVWIHGNGVNESASWNGYIGDYQNIDFNNSFILKEGKRYNYVIKTGSYPQIIHEHSKNVTGGEIICTKFTNANGEISDDWVPAIRFE